MTVQGTDTAARLGGSSIGGGDGDSGGGCSDRAGWRQGACMQQPAAQQRRHTQPFARGTNLGMQLTRTTATSEVGAAAAAAASDRAGWRKCGDRAGDQPGIGIPTQVGLRIHLKFQRPIALAMHIAKLTSRCAMEEGWVESERVQCSQEGCRQAGERTRWVGCTSRPAARETLSKEWTMVDPCLTSHCAVVGRVGGVRNDTRQSGGM